MVSVILVGIIALVAIIVVIRRGRWRKHTDQLPHKGVPPETLALEAFTQGNSCLAEGKFAEATAAFHRARELDPKRPHVADRLAEVERQQRLVIGMSPAGSIS